MLKKKAGAFNPKTISDLWEVMAQIVAKPHVLSPKIKTHD